MAKIFLPVVVFLFLCVRVHAQVDSAIGIKAPKSACRDIESLSHYLCDGLSTDHEKANAIYNWITHNIKYDLKAAKNGTQPREHQAEKALKNRRAVCEGYGMLFTDLCRAAGLKAVNIDGYAKDWVFDNGDKLYIPRHLWSGVYIDGKWQLADATWGAGYGVLEPSRLRKIYNKILHKKVWYAKNMTFKFKYNPTYFLQDPLLFRLKHAPADPIWQLTDTLMPIDVFEMGDSAVKAFNVRYPTLNQSAQKFLAIADLDEKTKAIESGDREYAYNHRFPAVKAVKQIYIAVSRVERAINDSTNRSGEALLKMANTELKNSQVFLKEQKDSFPSHYSELKAKNKIKNQDAKKYVAAIKADDKKQMAAYNKYSKSIDAKSGRIKGKVKQARQRQNEFYAGKINKIKVPRVQKGMDAPEMLALVDSYESRKRQIATVRDEVKGQTARIQLQDSLNRDRLDSLANFILLEDSALIEETKQRLAMHDSYDDEVIVWNRMFKRYKYQKTDTFQKYLLNDFDTLTKRIDERQKMITNAMNLYKKNLKSLEQYRKWNSTDTGFVHNYFECLNKYYNCINMYIENYSAYNEYLNRNQTLFSNLASVTRQQIKIAEYMGMAEEQRRKMEEKTLSNLQIFDNKENTRQATALTEMIGKLNEVTSKMD